MIGIEAAACTATVITTGVTADITTAMIAADSVAVIDGETGTIAGAATIMTAGAIGIVDAIGTATAVTNVNSRTTKAEHELKRVPLFHSKRLRTGPAELLVLYDSNRNQV